MGGRIRKKIKILMLNDWRKWKKTWGGVSFQLIYIFISVKMVRECHVSFLLKWDKKFRYYNENISIL